MMFRKPTGILSLAAALVAGAFLFTGEKERSDSDYSFKKNYPVEEPPTSEN